MTPGEKRVIDALAVGPLTADEIEAVAKFKSGTVYQYLSTLKKSGQVLITDVRDVTDIAFKSGKRVRRVYGLIGRDEPIDVMQESRGAQAHSARPKRVERKSTGSGQIAGPCRSRSYKWSLGTMF